MINLVLRSLHSVPQPLDDMVDVIGKDSAPVVDPRPGLCRVARPDCRRAIEVETAHIAPLDPPPLGNQPVPNDHRQTGRPSHLLDGSVLIEPQAGRYEFPYVNLYRRDTCI